MSQCVLPWVYPAWDSLWFLDLVDYFLSHVWEFFRSYLFKYFLKSFLSLSSPSGTPIMQMLVHLVLSQRSLRLSSFLFILFSIFCSVPVISTILSSRSFIHSASVILLLIASQLFSRSVMSNSLRLHELQHTRLPCPSPTPGVYSNSYPLSRWCHPAISSSVAPFSSSPNPSQHQGLFQWVSSSYQVAKVLEFQL